jgi:hypothetical protein
MFYKGDFLFSYEYDFSSYWQELLWQILVVMHYRYPFDY